MTKHIFILLIGIGKMVSGQTDTIPVILDDDTSIFFEDYLEDESDYLSGELFQPYDSILAKDTMYFRFFVEGGGAGLEIFLGSSQ